MIEGKETPTPLRKPPEASGHGCPEEQLSGIHQTPKEFTEEFIMGYFSILNNISAFYAQNQLGVTNSNS